MNVVEERNFPYPILLENGGDYNESYFHIKCSTSLSKDKKYILLDISYDLKCSFMEKLIAENKVAIKVKVEQRTFRSIANLSSGNNHLQLPMEWLSPNFNIEIYPMIVALENFKFDYDDSMDDVFSYFDDGFDIKKYQIMGYGEFKSIELPTNSKVGSIFTVSRLNDPVEIAKKLPYIITFDNHTIDIKVLPDIYDSFYNSIQMNASFNKILYSTFVYPAIQLAIITLSQDYDSVKDLKWCIAITNKIAKEKGISLTGNTTLIRDDIVEYTNVILDTLLQDAFEDIKNGGDGE